MLYGKKAAEIDWPPLNFNLKLSETEKKNKEKYHSKCQRLYQM